MLTKKQYCWLSSTTKLINTSPRLKWDVPDCMQDSPSWPERCGTDCGVSWWAAVLPATPSSLIGLLHLWHHHQSHDHHGGPLMYSHYFFLPFLNIQLFREWSWCPHYSFISGKIDDVMWWCNDDVMPAGQCGGIPQGARGQWGWSSWSDWSKCDLGQGGQKPVHLWECNDCYGTTYTAVMAPFNMHPAVDILLL